MLLLDGSFHRWLEDRGPQLTLLGFLDDATRKVPVAEFFPTEDARGYCPPLCSDSGTKTPPRSDRGIAGWVTLLAAGTTAPHFRD